MGAGGDARRQHPLRGLFTKEDHGHVHKMLGISVMCHFIWRFAHVGPTKDMLFGPTNKTLACIALHATLSASSLIFRIPIKRIAEGSRIWPEYRLHSISFAYRSLACMLVTWLEMRYGVTEPFYPANGAIVIGTMLLADFGSWWVGPAGRSSTIQELDAPPFARFFFSVMQFSATAGCLVGVRRFGTQFIYVWVIRARHTHAPAFFWRAATHCLAQMRARHRPRSNLPATPSPSTTDLLPCPRARPQSSPPS